jgi:polygalacturonase
MSLMKLGATLCFSFVFAGLALADPNLPNINTSVVFDVTNTIFAGGALGNGVSNSAAAIQAAINMASTQFVGGVISGATVRIPAVGTLSTYLCGPINLARNVNLLIDTNAELQMLPKSAWSGTTTFINGATLTDVEISGSGTIDGQGSSGWWAAGGSRPDFIEFEHCKRVLIQGVTLQNAPTFHIMVHDNNGNLTIQNMTINTPDGTPNTDGIDLASTNVLIRNCYISDGDDNIQIGSSSAYAYNITISNCTFGTGHGLSIGSPTSGGVSNLVVSNCWWVGTEYGVHGKTDDSTVIQNLRYMNLYMTNVNFPIAFYSHYGYLGTPSSTITVPPSTAVSQGSCSGSPLWSNIIISNLEAVGNSGPDGPGNIAGILWGCNDTPITNVTLVGVNIQGRSSGRGTFCIYQARDIKIIDSSLTAPTAGTNTLTLYDAEVTVTNSANTNGTVTITGLGTPSNSVLSVFNAQAETGVPGVLGSNPLLTLASSTFTVSNAMSLGGSSVLNYGLRRRGGPITGSGSVSAGASGVAYSISSVSGANTYTWTVPSGASIASGQGSTSITVNYSCSANSGSITVTPSNGSCSGTSTNLAVTVTSVGAAGSISGPTPVCAGQAALGYSISSVSGATTYTWSRADGSDDHQRTGHNLDYRDLGFNRRQRAGDARQCQRLHRHGFQSACLHQCRSGYRVESFAAVGLCRWDGKFHRIGQRRGLSYQWQKNGSNISDSGTISGSGTTTLTLTGVGTGDSGASFDCVVSGTCSPPATSGAATLTVNANPAIFNVTGGGSYCAATGGG